MAKPKGVWYSDKQRKKVMALLKNSKSVRNFKSHSNKIVASSNLNERERIEKMIRSIERNLVLKGKPLITQCRELEKEREKAANKAQKLYAKIVTLEHKLKNPQLFKLNPATVKNKIEQLTKERKELLQKVDEYNSKLFKLDDKLPRIKVKKRIPLKDGVILESERYLDYDFAIGEVVILGEDKFFKNGQLEAEHWILHDGDHWFGKQSDKFMEKYAFLDEWGPKLLM